MASADQRPPSGTWRQRLYDVIFRADTPAGRAFDVVLIIAILTSILTVMLDSIAWFRASYAPLLVAVEWGFTLLFTVEYGLRLICVRRPLRYATSFFGVVDLLAVLPTYLSLLFVGSQYFLVVRVLRLLRIFRILKLAEYLQQADVLRRALQASRQKISVFLLTVLTIVTIVGALMYLIEGEASGFTDIPTSMYWAIVTLTTVGYGDIAPQTPLGKMLASLLMLMGYGVIAVPTGIVTIELTRASQPPLSNQRCPTCGATSHDSDAAHCKYCGTRLAG